MLFGTGSRLFGLFATHPPLTERIKALDPTFNEQDYPQIDEMAEHAHSAQLDEDKGSSGLASALAGAAVLPETIAASVGRPGAGHVEYARELRRTIPDKLYDAAHSTELAYLLTLALVLDRSGDDVDRQLALIKERMGEKRTGVIRDLYKELGATSEAFRLPLLEISFPALKLRPAPQLTYLIDLASRLIHVDDNIDLYEYCIFRILSSSLGQAIDPSGRRARVRAPKRELRQAAVNLLAIVADHGHEDVSTKQEAFDAGAAMLGKWASDVKIEPQPEYTVDILAHSLDVLMKLNGKGRRKLLRAIVEVADHDNRLTIAEAELIRVVCATLDCPLPPVLIDKQEGGGGD